RVHGHKGLFTMLTTSLMGLGGTGPALRFEIDGDGAATKLLAMGVVFWVDGTTAATLGDVWKDTSSPAAQAALFSSNLNGNFTNGFATLPNVTAQQSGMEASDALILEGLALLRAARIEPPNTRAPGVTDLKIFRVHATAGMDRTAVEIRR